MFLDFYDLSYVCILYTNIAKNPLRTFLGLNFGKNKNIKAWPKKGVII